MTAPAAAARYGSAGGASSKRTSPSKRGTETMWKGDDDEPGAAFRPAGGCRRPRARPGPRPPALAPTIVVSKPGGRAAPWKTAAIMRSAKSSGGGSASGPACAAQIARHSSSSAGDDALRLQDAAGRRRGRWSGCRRVTGCGTPARASPSRRWSAGSSPRRAGRSGPAASVLVSMVVRVAVAALRALQLFAAALVAGGVDDLAVVGDHRGLDRDAVRRLGLVVVDLGEERDACRCAGSRGCATAAPAARP